VTTLVRNGVKLHVSFQSTPALFVAVDDNYCGCDECAGTLPMGWGKTAEEAVADLLEQIEAAA
jgi:hypothetical protein